MTVTTDRSFLILSSGATPKHHSLNSLTLNQSRSLQHAKPLTPQSLISPSEVSFLTCPLQHFQTLRSLQPTVMASCVIRSIMISMGNSACTVACITHVISMGNKPWQGRTGEGEGAPVCDTPLQNKWPHLTRYWGTNRPKTASNSLETLTLRKFGF